MPYSNIKKSPQLEDLFKLKNRSALIIGGAGLLGSEICDAFAELNAKILIASRDTSKGKELIDNLKIKHPNLEAYSLKVDITDNKSIDSLMSEVSKITNNKLDILVNCGNEIKKNTFESISNEDWDNDINCTLNGVFKTVKAATPLLKSSQKGNILFIGSMYGHVAPDYRLYDDKKFANPPSYGAGKAGIIQLTKYLASFLSTDGIRVNCISPGPFPYESTQKENPEFIERLGSKNPLNRIGIPHEIKGVAALLCSDASSYITGQNICIDGGWSIW